MNKRIVLVFLMVVNAVCFSGCGDSTATSVPAMVKPTPVVASVQAQPKVVPQACQFGTKDKLLYNSVEQFKKKTLACLNPQSTNEEKNQYFKAFFDYLIQQGETLDETINRQLKDDVFDIGKARRFIFLLPDGTEGMAWYHVNYSGIADLLKIMPTYVQNKELQQYLSLAEVSMAFRIYDAGFSGDWQGLANLLIAIESFESTYPSSVFSTKKAVFDEIFSGCLANNPPYYRIATYDEKGMVSTSVSVGSVEEGVLTAYQHYLALSKQTKSKNYQYIQKLRALLLVLEKDATNLTTMKKLSDLTEKRCTDYFANTGMLQM